MTSKHTRLTLLLLATLCIVPAHAQDTTLKTITNPTGGTIIYGPVTGQTTPQAAMASVLHFVHGKFNDRPEVLSIFQSRDGHTFGASFIATQTGKPLAGLAIISLAPGASPAAAVLFDDASRFRQTQPILMKKLDEAWHIAATPASSTATRSGAPQALHTVTGGDRSASIALPDGWQITGVSGGQLTAEGPNGESINLGILYQQIRDPRAMQNPRTPAYYKMGAGSGLNYPMGGDLFAAFASLANQKRQQNHLPTAAFQLIASTPDANDPHAIQCRYEVDLHDGKGPRLGSGRIGELGVPGAPVWAMTISSSSIPKPLVESEQPTMNAIVKSYSQNAAVINGELQQSLAQIKAVGDRSRQQAADADQRREASSAAFNAHMDNIDRMSKSMQNYTLDRTELQDTAYNKRGAVDNSYAAALIKADPDRFQSVPAQSFLRGVDY
jgi:hypothetical protein